MTSERDQAGPERHDDARGIDTRWTPSQAEGGRDTVDEDLEEKASGRQEAQRPDDAGGQALSTPSQAEGDRETVEDDIEEKLGGSGQHEQK